MRNWLRSLWLMLDTQNCGYTSHGFDGWIEADVLNVLTQSWLRETSAAEYVVCPECLDHHEQPVKLKSPGGDARWFIPCPEYGRVRLRPEELRQWFFDLNAIATDVARAFSLTGTVSLEIPDKLWHLGRASWQQKSREVWLLRDWRSLSEAELKSAMKPAARAIVLTYDNVVPEPLWPGRSPAFVALSRVSQWCDNRLSFDAMQLVECVTDQDDMVSETPAVPRQRVPARAIRRQVKEEIASMLTDEALVAAYHQHGSVRLAAESLSKQTNTEISKDKVRRTLKRSGTDVKAPARHNSDSVRRTNGT